MLNLEKDEDPTSKIEATTPLDFEIFTICAECKTEVDKATSKWGSKIVCWSLKKKDQQEIHEKRDFMDSNNYLSNRSGKTPSNTILPIPRYGTGSTYQICNWKKTIRKYKVLPITKSTATVHILLKAVKSKSESLSANKKGSQISKIVVKKGVLKRFLCKFIGNDTVGNTKQKF